MPATNLKHLALSTGVKIFLTHIAAQDRQNVKRGAEFVKKEAFCSSMKLISVENQCLFF